MQCNCCIEIIALLLIRTSNQPVFVLPALYNFFISIREPKVISALTAHDQACKLRF
jgi:hypothetical protein